MRKNNSKKRFFYFGIKIEYKGLAALAVGLSL